MKLAMLLMILVGCVTSDPQVAETDEERPCLDCDPGGGPALPRCTTVCSSNSDCGTPCTLSNGSESTCGGAGICVTCASACTATASCGATCKSPSGITSCGNYGTCQKYDVYCTYPVITDAAVSNNHESFLNNPGYMYYASATSPKSGTYASFIGGYYYGPYDNWASNFRGPVAVTGESSRTQWEFGSPDRLDAWYPPAGAPYMYGKQCISSTTGDVPRLTTRTEDVWEDDECILGFCNGDDRVGSFTIDRGLCNTTYFDVTPVTGWTQRFDAAVSGDVSRVGYKLYCYSCMGSWTPTCSNGVVP